MPPAPTTLPAHGFGPSDRPGSFGGCRKHPEGQVLRPGAVTRGGHLLSGPSKLEIQHCWVWSIPSHSFAPNLLVPIPAGMLVGSAAPVCSLSDLPYPSHSGSFSQWASWPEFSCLHLSFLEYCLSIQAFSCSSHAASHRDFVPCQVTFPAVPWELMVLASGGAQGSLHIPLRTLMKLKNKKNNSNGK